VSVSFDAVKEALQQKNTKKRNTQKEVEGAKTKQSKFAWWMQTEQSM
jgi:hypothetical protein